MSQLFALSVVDRDPALPVTEGLRRAVSELVCVRSGMEEAFETIHAHAGAHALEHARYLVAMQSIDSLSQQLAAVERFILNITGTLDDSHVIHSKAAASGITLAAVATRLTTSLDSAEHDSGECDFF